MGDRFDLTVMRVTHNALRRDLGLLADAAARLEAGDRRGRQAVLAGWETMKAMLDSHHNGEDRYMWPRMRAGLRSRPDDLAVLDAMEAEHQRIDPLVRSVDAALRAPDAEGAKPAQAVQAFGDDLGSHLAHEEEAALPLVQVAMTPEEWDRCLRDMRGGLAALRSAPEFFPWLLDRAEPRDKAEVFALMPPPLRVVCQKIWMPRYARRPRWA